jgi:hypothetical protein
LHTWTCPPLSEYVCEAFSLPGVLTCVVGKIHALKDSIYNSGKKMRMFFLVVS